MKGTELHPKVLTGKCRRRGFLVELTRGSRGLRWHRFLLKGISYQKGMTSVFITYTCHLGENVICKVIVIEPLSVTLWKELAHHLCQGAVECRAVERMVMESVLQSFGTRKKGVAFNLQWRVFQCQSSSPLTHLVFIVSIHCISHTQLILYARYYNKHPNYRSEQDKSNSVPSRNHVDPTCLAAKGNVK